MPIVVCLYCSKSFNKVLSQIKRGPNHFCSSSCAVTYNNTLKPKRKRKLMKKCRDCSILICKRERFCVQCSDKYDVGCMYLKTATLRDVMYVKHHKSSAWALVRMRAKGAAKRLGWKKCVKCGYDKHIEIAHVKAISSFPLDALLNDVSHESNLLPLCRNCYWEFDHLEK